MQKNWNFGEVDNPSHNFRVPPFQNKRKTPLHVRPSAGPPLIRPKSPHVCLDWKKTWKKKLKLLNPTRQPTASSLSTDGRSSSHSDLVTEIRRPQASLQILFPATSRHRHRRQRSGHRSELSLLLSRDLSLSPAVLPSRPSCGFRWLDLVGDHIWFGDLVLSAFWFNRRWWTAMWSGSNSGRPRGGAASMGYADLIVWVWVGGRWLGLGFHLSSLSLNLFSSFHCKERKKIGCFACMWFSYSSLHINFSLVGKQSLLSVAIKLKLFSIVNTT
jgi:hypothetical protein